MLHCALNADEFPRRTDGIYSAVVPGERRITSESIQHSHRIRSARYRECTGRIHIGELKSRGTVAIACDDAAPIQQRVNKQARTIGELPFGAAIQVSAVLVRQKPCITGEGHERPAHRESVPDCVPRGAVHRGHSIQR